MVMIVRMAPVRLALAAIVLAGLAASALQPALAQTAKRDGIADLLKRNGASPPR